MSHGNKVWIDISPDEVPSEKLYTQIYVIAGGPCSGKSSLINALEDKNYLVKREPAELILKQEITSGKSALEVRKDPVSWQQRVAKADFELLKSIIASRLILIDTSLIETYVYTLKAGIDFGDHLKKYLQQVRFKGVFFLEPLTLHQTTEVRIEDQMTAHELSKGILEAYQFFGYKPVRIPALPIEQRLDLIFDSLPTIPGCLVR